MYSTLDIAIHIAAGTYGTDGNNDFRIFDNDLLESLAMHIDTNYSCDNNLCMCLVICISEIHKHYQLFTNKSNDALGFVLASGTNIRKPYHSYNTGTYSFTIYA